jgi:hypothetical protein
LLLRMLYLLEFVLRRRRALASNLFRQPSSGQMLEIGVQFSQGLTPTLLVSIPNSLFIRDELVPSFEKDSPTKACRQVRTAFVGIHRMCLFQLSVPVTVVTC